MRNTKRRPRYGPHNHAILGLVLLVLIVPGCGEAPSTGTIPADAEVTWIRYPDAAPASPQGSYGWDAAPRGFVRTFELDGARGGMFPADHVTLVFPARTLEGTYTLTVRQPDPTVGVWEFTLDPPVVAFDRPVRLMVDYRGYSRTRDHRILWLDGSRNVWVDLGAEDLPGQGLCRVDLWHFSTYGATDGTAGWD